MKTTEDKVYHIYMNNNCVYHNLRREEFSYLWGLLRHISSNNQDINLEYEELSEDMKTTMASY
jgi:hypothetical protein